MNYIADKTILLLSCMISLAFTPPDVSFVLAFLIAVSVGALSYALDLPRLSLITAIFCVFAVFLLPQLALFLPLITYELCLPGKDAKDFHRFLPFALPLFPFLHFFATGSFQIPLLLLLLFGCLLSLWLRFRTDCQEELVQKYRKTQDDDTERKLLLEERNQSLLEKQDSEIYAATLRERNRIAREIHDNVGHMLTRSILMVGALQAVPRDPALAEPLSQLEGTLNQAMNSIRQSVHDLHDSSVNLQETLESMVQEFSFCPLTLHYEMSPLLPRDVKYSFIAVAREALVNITRHSSATAAEITAIEHPGFYQFIIQDNGKGAPGMGNAPALESPGRDSSGIGLTNIQSRVRAMNGTLRIVTEHGFCIHITVPK